MLRRCHRHGAFYHAIILSNTLLIYSFLVYHDALDTHGTIRRFYKATIYGFVGYRFISTHKSIRHFDYSYTKHRVRNVVHYQRN